MHVIVAFVRTIVSFVCDNIVWLSNNQYTYFDDKFTGWRHPVCRHKCWTVSLIVSCRYKCWAVSLIVSCRYSLELISRIFIDACEQLWRFKHIGASILEFDVFFSAKNLGLQAVIIELSPAIVFLCHLRGVSGCLSKVSEHCFKMMIESWGI
jgi:hypothetical protein